MHRVLGKGAYGIVRCVEDERTKKLYACKELKKQWLLAKGTKAIDCALMERQMLCEMSSPYIVKLHWALQDDNALYMVCYHFSLSHFLLPINCYRFEFLSSAFTRN